MWPPSISPSVGTITNTCSVLFHLTFGSVKQITVAFALEWQTDVRQRDAPLFCSWQEKWRCFQVGSGNWAAAVRHLIQRFQAPAACHAYSYRAIIRHRGANHRYVTRVCLTGGSLRDSGVHMRGSRQVPPSWRLAIASLVGDVSQVPFWGGTFVNSVLLIVSSPSGLHRKCLRMSDVQHTKTLALCRSHTVTHSGRHAATAAWIRDGRKLTAAGWEMLSLQVHYGSVCIISAWMQCVFAWVCVCVCMCWRAPSHKQRKRFDSRGNIKRHLLAAGKIAPLQPCDSADYWRQSTCEWHRATWGWWIGRLVSCNKRGRHPVFTRPFFYLEKKN